MTLLVPRSLRAALLACALLAPRPLVARPVHADRPVEFTAEVPDALSPVPNTREGVLAFAEARAGSEPFALVLRPLPSTIDRAGFTEREAREVIQSIAPGSTVRLEHASAMADGFDVPLIVAHGAQGDGVMVVATLPSAPRAVQLTVTAGAGDEARAIATARSVAASFRAPTNWLTSGELARRRAAYALLVLGWGVLGAYGVVWLLRLRARPSARAHAAWLAGAGAAFVATAALLATVRTGATAIRPWMPAALGAVLLANAIASARRASP